MKLTDATRRRCLPDSKPMRNKLVYLHHDPGSPPCDSSYKVLNSKRKVRLDTLKSWFSTSHFVFKSWFSSSPQTIVLKSQSLIIINLFQVCYWYEVYALV